jgi:uncharacterized membrane protein YeiB
LRRIAGLDIARGLALVGMVYAHTVPDPASGAETVFDGRSSILFATIAGVSLGLMTGGIRRPVRGERGHVVTVVAVRGLLLILVGVLLTTLQTPIAIILDTYGFLFLVAIPLLFAPPWVVALVAAASASLGPILVTTLTAATTGPDAAGTNPWAYFALRWLEGTYPAPVWLAYIAVGILIARSGIRTRTVQLGIAAAGAASAIVVYSVAAAVGHPVLAHTDTTWEVLASGGVAVAVIGLCTWLTESTTPRVSQHVQSVLRPLSAAGSMPLTIYTVQVVAIWAYLAAIRYDGPFLGWQNLGVFFAIAVPLITLATLWRRRFEQGPLEWLVSRVSTQRPWPRSDHV